MIVDASWDIGNTNICEIEERYKALVTSFELQALLQQV